MLMRLRFNVVIWIAKLLRIPVWNEIEKDYSHWNDAAKFLARQPHIQFATAFGNTLAEHSDVV